MIGGGIAVLVIILIPFLLGILSPTSKQTMTPTQSKRSGDATAVPTQGAFALSPDPTNPQSSSEYVRMANEYNENPKTPTPEPTLDLDSLLPTTPVTPTPTPLRGPFYTANGRQNDLTLKLYQVKDWDLTYEVQLINARTREVRIMGYQSVVAPGDSMFFRNKFSEVVFLGGSKTDYQKISLYSIPKNFVTKNISLVDMKRALPSLQIQATAILSRMMLSPDEKRVAVSYGNTFNVSLIEPNTRIIVIDLTTNKMRLLDERGLVRGWKDNSTLEYETRGADPNVNTVGEIKL